MQPKVLFILLAVIIAGFAAMSLFDSSTDAPVVAEAASASVSDESEPEAIMVTDKPLGQQPKAILDKANDQFQQAQQAQNDQLAELDAIQ